MVTPQPGKWTARERIRHRVLPGQLTQHQQIGEASIRKQVEHRSIRVEYCGRIGLRKRLDPDPQKQ
jgi:hypothetical protein